jgi:hypothetical protein
MARDADAAWPLKWEVSFLLAQADRADEVSGAFMRYGPHGRLA